MSDKCIIVSLAYTTLEIIFRKAAAHDWSSKRSVKHYEPYTLFSDCVIVEVATHPQSEPEDLGSAATIVELKSGCPNYQHCSFSDLVWPWCECWVEQMSPPEVKCYWIYGTQRTSRIRWASQPQYNEQKMPGNKSRVMFKDITSKIFIKINVW